MSDPQIIVYASDSSLPSPTKMLREMFSFSLNPLSPIILTSRDWLTGFAPEHLGPFLMVNLATVALVWMVFRLAMPILIKRMSA